VDAVPARIVSGKDRAGHGFGFRFPDRGHHNIRTLVDIDPASRETYDKRSAQESDNCRNNRHFHKRESFLPLQAPIIGRGMSEEGFHDKK
jgi:hypothetical protein